MAAIKHFLKINATPETVYKAITEKEGIQGWWTPDVVIEPREGSVAEFIFKPNFHNKMKIANLEPEQEVQWKCLDGDEQWIGTSLVFSMEEEEEGQTALRFQHKDWEAETDFFAFCNFNWGFYLNSLKNYCENGQGDPYTPPA